MIKLPDVLTAWNLPDFPQVFTTVIQSLDVTDLPLQQALSHSSYVSNSPITVIILYSEATDKLIRVKSGIFYFGIIAGSCCSDDPGPACEENEYCEVQIEIDRITAEARISLL